MVPSGSRAAASAAHKVIAPNLSKKTRAPIAAVALFIAVAGATHFLHGRVYYPHVVVEAQENVRLEFLQQGLPRNEACESAVATIADAIRASCPACRVAIRQCSGRLEPAYEKLLSEDPIEMPSSRFPHGVVAYVSDNKALALAACREAERLTGANGGATAVCYPADTRRPIQAKPQRFEPAQVLAGLMILLLAGLTSVFVGHLIVRYDAFHANWSYDPVKTGPQKFHSAPTPRIGGLGVMAGLFLSGAVLLAIMQSASSEQFGYLLLAGLPAFAGGIAEDATKNVGVLTRLLLTMLAAAFGVWLLGAVIPRLDIPGFDTLLEFLAWNYPKGKIFLGDGGAYLLGFWLAELSVLLVARHPEVSPWFPMLLLVYPIFETLFSMYRRKVLQGVPPGQPDGLHLHQAIYAHLSKIPVGDTDPASVIRRNNRVAPYSWLMSLCCAVPAMMLWKDTPWLVAISLVFCAGYVWLYKHVLRRKSADLPPVDAT